MHDIRNAHPHSHPFSHTYSTPPSHSQVRAAADAVRAIAAARLLSADELEAGLQPVESGAELLLFSTVLLRAYTPTLLHPKRGSSWLKAAPTLYGSTAPLRPT